MNLNQFCQYSGLLGSKELEKVRLRSFFFHKTAGKSKFTKDDILSWFKDLNLPKPNLSRLTSNIQQSLHYSLIEAYRESLNGFLFSMESRAQAVPQRLLLTFPSTISPGFDRLLYVECSNRYYNAISNDSVSLRQDPKTWITICKLQKLPGYSA